MAITTLEQAIQAIEVLQSQMAQTAGRMNNLQELSEEQLTAARLALGQADKACEFARNMYRVDHYGYLWKWNTETHQYEKTTSRICTPVIADEAVTTEKLAVGAITTDKIADDAVTTEKIGNGEVKTRNIGPDAVTEDKIGAGEVKTRNIGPGAVTTDKIEDYDPESAAPTGVTTEKIAAGAVTEGKIGALAVTATKIAPNAVQHENLGAGCVQAGDIAPNAVQNSNLAPNAVQEGNIAPGAIHTEDIHDGAVTTAKIEDYNPNSETPTGVTTAKIADEAVTEDKLAPQAVTTDKLAPGLISEIENITDAVPTAGSVKPVQSGGVFDSFLASACLKEIKDLSVLSNTAFQITAGDHHLIQTSTGGLNVRYYQIKVSGYYYIISYNISEDASSITKSYLHKIGLFNTEPAIDSIPTYYESKSVVSGQTTISKLYITAGQYVAFSYSSTRSQCSLFSNSEEIMTVSDSLSQEDTNPVSSSTVKGAVDVLTSKIEFTDTHLLKEDVVEYTRVSKLITDIDDNYVKTAGATSFQVAYVQIPLDTNYYRLVITSTDNQSHADIQVIGLTDVIPANGVSFTTLDYKRFTESGTVYEKVIDITEAIKGKYLIISTHSSIPITIKGQYLINVPEEIDEINSKLYTELNDSLEYTVVKRRVFNSDTNEINTAGSDLYSIAYWFIPSDTIYDSIKVASVDGVSNKNLRYIGTTDEVPNTGVSYTLLDYTRFYNTGNTIVKDIPVTDQIKGKYLVVSIHTTTSNLVLTGHAIVEKADYAEIEIEDLENRVSSIEEDIEEGKKTYRVAKMFTPKIDIRKSGLKILHIGNSFMNGCLTHLQGIITAAGIDISDMCLYTAYRGGASFLTWYNCYHDNDSEPHHVDKRFGGITLDNVEGSSPAYDGTAFRNALTNAQWDLIIIQPYSGAGITFDSWENSEKLIEFVRLLKTLQPQAEIGMNFTHASYSSATGKYITQVQLWSSFASAIKEFMCKYDVDFIIPYGTAIENIKTSVINTTTYGFEHDRHHLAKGVGHYVAGATYYQSLFASRYGVSILGNTFRYDVTADKEAAQGEPGEYPDEFVSVTNDNAYACQMAAIMACNNMFSIQNPDGVEL